MSLLAHHSIILPAGHRADSSELGCELVGVFPSPIDARAWEHDVRLLADHVHQTQRLECGALAFLPLHGRFACAALALALARTEYDPVSIVVHTTPQRRWER